MTENQPIDDMTFGAALAELEATVRQLEGGQLELEDSLALYERGVALIAALQSKLSDAELKVNELVGKIAPEAAPAAASGASASSGE